MTLQSKWISGHAIVPDWPVRGGEQRVVSADEAEAELRRLRDRIERLRDVLKTCAGWFEERGDLLSRAFCMAWADETEPLP